MEPTSDSLFEDVMTGMPPDAVPTKRGRGRPPGSTNKPKSAAENEPDRAERERELKQWLPGFSAMLAARDFTQFGGADRSLLLLVRDVSPSEQKEEFEREFNEGGNAIAPMLAADRMAANLVDVALCHGAEWFKVMACDHVNSFRMPDTVSYGAATHGAPWFYGIPALVNKYREHLASVGLGVAAVYVVVASDYLLGDNFVAALDAFRAFQADPAVVVIPAGFGNWVPEVAEKVSVNTKPVHLTDLRIKDFVRIVTESIREVSRARPEDRAALLKKLENLKA